MIEWGQKSKPQILPRASNKTPKTPGRKINSPQKIHTKLPSLKNFQKALRDKTRKGLQRTTQPGYAGTTTNLQIVLDYPKKPLLKSSHPKNVSTPKKQESKISDPKKSFDLPHLLKSGVSPPPATQQIQKKARMDKL